MTEAERDAVCVKRRLPRTWEEARDALEGDIAMRDLLGGVVEGFLAVGETLDGLLHSPASEAERVQMLVENH
ncbi:hypothetical protein M405DRAFT_811910 [Rhizopogon salebrosus TDB-379]|nr:hypothetical protein M405DRAFT_811910 [Rhizopogon salebrosus TDB-379]